MAKEFIFTNSKQEHRDSVYGRTLTKSEQERRDSIYGKMIPDPPVGRIKMSSSSDDYYGYHTTPYFEEEE